MSMVVCIIGKPALTAKNPQAAGCAPELCGRSSCRRTIISTSNSSARQNRS
jgi:hypothetical protein